MPGYAEEDEVTGTKAVVGAGCPGLPRDTGGRVAGHGWVRVEDKYRGS